MIEVFIEKAIELSIQNVKEGGGPFAAVIVKNREVLSVGVNEVIQKNDPTAHAEIQAIREACRKINSYDLSGCIIYSSCEPCPMCFGAIYWAHINKVYYCNSREDAREIGFDDDFIYTELNLPPFQRKIPSIQIKRRSSLEAFQLWSQMENKLQY